MDANTALLSFPICRNTGHDFAGRSTGRGALSVWTHNLKSFEFIASYNVTGHHDDGEPTLLYSGMAARVGTGLESWETFALMRRHGMQLGVPGDSTVAPYGGWAQGGGHHSLASLLGLGADQVLSLQVVTADGRLVTADHVENADLFWALRGGGPCTFARHHQSPSCTAGAWLCLGKGLSCKAFVTSAGLSGRLGHDHASA